MSISLKQALVFVPKNDKWIQNILTGGLVLFFPTFAYFFPGIRRMIFDPINYFLVALFIVFTVVVYLAVSGYFFKTVHNRVVHDKEGLPKWKYFSYYVYVGFKSCVGGFIFSIPFIFFLILMLAITPVSMTKAIIPYAIITGIVYLLYVFLYTMVALNFVTEFKISAFWNLKKAYELIHGNMTNYIMLVLYCLVVAAVHFILIGILANAQILALLIPFVSYYVYLMYTDLFAQFIQNKEKVCSNEENYAV